MWKWLLVGALAIGGVFYMMIKSGADVNMGGESGGIDQHMTADHKPAAASAPAEAPAAASAPAETSRPDVPPAPGLGTSAPAK